MMHPNHKLQTRLQIIKRLLNTPNCELILKNIISEIQLNPINFNTKLAFYLHALINTNNKPGGEILGNQITKNDREILAHLNEILHSSGLNFKKEMQKITIQYLKSNPSSSGFEYSEKLLNNGSSDPFMIVEPMPSLHHHPKPSVDFLNQCDKEFDEEIFNIYSRNNKVFKRFLMQFEKFTQELNQYSMNSSNQVVSLHSNVKKTYFQRLKDKHIQLYDTKKKWMRLIDNMTHERCIWHDPAAATHFTILDQTEGQNRERRRLKKSHLFIPERFFKPELRGKVACEKHPSQLRYLLGNYEDYSASENINFEDGNNSISTGDYYMMYHLKKSEVLK